MEQGDRVLGDEYVACNPFIPRRDNLALIPSKVQVQRNPQHVKRILDQWHQCATQSQSDTIKSFYRNLLVNIAENGRHLWGELVHEITVDKAMEVFQKVLATAQAVKHAEKHCPNKRRAAANNGPANKTPLSAMRKRKGRKQNAEDEQGNTV